MARFFFNFINLFCTNFKSQSYSLTAYYTPKQSEAQGIKIRSQPYICYYFETMFYVKRKSDKRQFGRKPKSLTFKIWYVRYVMVYPFNIHGSIDLQQ